MTPAQTKSNLRAAIVAICFCVAAPAIAEGPATPAGPPSNPLEQFSDASQALYSKISASLIHVHVDPTYATVLTPAQRKDFLDWMRAQNADLAKDSAETQPAAPLTRRDQRQQIRNEALRGANTPDVLPAPKPAVGVMFRRYIDQKLKDPGTDPLLVTRLRQAANRLQQPVGETLAVMIDDQGDALLLGTWVRDGVPPTVRVTVPDGREMSAKLVGTHPARGLAIIKLESPGAAAPLVLAEGNPAPGQLLMCVTANTGGVGWISAPPGNPKRAGEESRFAVFSGEDRGAAYLFNAKGEFAAVGLERFALPVDVIRADAKWIIENRKDVAPRQLGVRYTPVTPATRRSVRALGNRPAVVVGDVVGGSPADRAGLKKDDIVISIDRHPIWQMAQIQWDIATQVDSVPVGIIRDEKELTLDMPLDDK